MSLQSDGKIETSLVPELNRVIVVENIFGYLRKMSPQVGLFAEKLTKSTLKMVNFFVAERMGWEVVQRYEGKQGTEGVLGNYRIEHPLDDSLTKKLSEEQQNREGFFEKNTMAGNESRFVHESVREILHTALTLGRNEFLNCKHLSSDIKTKFEKLGTYPLKKDGEASIVRLIVPSGKKKGFVDLKLRDALTMFDDRLFSNNTKLSSDMELLLLTGDTHMIRGDAYDKPVRDMSEWDENLDGEPPWMVLSISDSSEILRVRDPRIFSHVNVVINKDRAPESINIDFGHVGSWGKEADQFGDDICLNSLEKWRNLEAPLIEEEWSSPEDFWQATNASLEKFSDAIGGDTSAVFGSDRMLLELAKTTDIFQVDSELGMGGGIGKYLRDHSKNWGGAVGIMNLGVLLTDGHAPFFMVNHEGKSGLQVALGLGGLELTAKLRDLTARVSQHRSLMQWSEHDVGNLAEFRKYWTDSRWIEYFSDEKSRASHDGLGSISTLGAMTGPLRDRVEKLAGKVVTQWASFMKSRWQVSSLGSISKKLLGIVKKKVFFTAGSRDTGAVIGIKGNDITGQFYAKDPLIWIESIVKVIKYETNGVLKLDLLQCANKLLSSGEFTKSNISEDSMIRVLDWLDRVNSGADLERANFGRISMGGRLRDQEAPIDVYMKSMGEDVDMREEVIGTARTMATIFANVLSDKDTHPLWKLMIKEQAKLHARTKLANVVINAIKLAIVDEMSVIEKFGDLIDVKSSSVLENIGIINQRIQWIKDLELILQQEQLKLGEFWNGKMEEYVSRGSGLRALRSLHVMGIEPRKSDSIITDRANEKLQELREQFSYDERANDNSD